jgi:hypothetical protein
MAKKTFNTQPINTGKTELDDFIPDPNTQDKWSVWKHDHPGKLTQFVIERKEEDGGGYLFAYCRKPDRLEYQAYFQTRTQDTFRALELLYNTCILYQDPEIRDESKDYYISLLFNVFELVDLYNVQVKKR